MTIRKIVSKINILNFFFGIIVCGMLSFGILLVMVHVALQQDDGHCGVKIDCEVSIAPSPFNRYMPYPSLKNSPIHPQRRNR